VRLGRGESRPLNASAPRTALSSRSRSRRTRPTSASPQRRRSGGRRAALLLGQSRPRAELELLLRRGAHGGRGRLDHPAGRQRPYERPIRASSARTGSGSTRSSSTTRPTTATARARCRAPRAPGLRCRAAVTATSSGRSTCRSLRDGKSRSRCPTQVTTASTSAASRSMTSCSPRAPARRRSRTTAHLDGWTVPGPQPGSAPNANDWIVGHVRRHADPRRRARGPGTRPPVGRPRLPDRPLRALPVRVGLRGGGRPPRARVRAGDPDPASVRPRFFENRSGPPNSSVIVHELAHEWAGAYLAVDTWQHIWLNEGFVT
jgi:hypothetical protein